tara:strand:- start:567 stop:749 length:183 start_codon:yes stop_codon:yes gene_type:complete
MSRTITQHETDRRLAIAEAKMTLTEACSRHGLTSIEWLQVFHEMSKRMLSLTLKEDWDNE